MNKLTPRQLNALILIGLGAVLLKATDILMPGVPADMLFVQASVHFLSPIGAVLFLVGLYRYNSKGK